MIDIKGPLSYFSISLIGGVPIGARALPDISLIWFGNIAHLYLGFKASGFETSGFKTSEKLGLQNVRFTKC